MKKTGFRSLPLLVIVTAILLVFVFSFSCGLIARVGTETPSEKKIAAEFNLAPALSCESKSGGKKILVLVNQPAWLGAPVVLRQMLSEQIISQLIDMAKIRSSYIIPYKQLSEFRSKEPNFNQMSEEEIAKKLGADVVLLIGIDSFNLLNLAGSNVYKGSLAGKAALIEVSDSKQLWPEEGGKIISVGFDMEQNQQAALKRLANSFSHCLTRYLYDCPLRRFKTADDRSGIGWRDWEK